MLEIYMKHNRNGIQMNQYLFDFYAIAGLDLFVYFKLLWAFVFDYLSNIQLKQIFEAYQQFSEIDIDQAIQIYTDSNLHHILLAIGIENKFVCLSFLFDLFLVRIIRNRPQFFAYELKNSIKVNSSTIQYL